MFFLKNRFNELDTAVKNAPQSKQITIVIIVMVPLMIAILLDLSIR